MSKTPKFRTAYTRDRVVTRITDSSLTKQASRDECDINLIMKKYQKTGLLEHANRYEGRYGNFITADDYQAHLNQVIEAEAAFSTLPARVRKEFDNDPAVFLDFVHDPKNQDAIYELGLAERPSPPPEPTRAFQPGAVGGAPAPKGASSDSTPTPPPGGS